MPSFRSHGLLTTSIRIAVWRISLTNILIRSACQQAKVEGYPKLLACADILVALSTFALNQAVNAIEIRDTEEKDREKAIPGKALDISGDYVEMAKAVVTGFGIIYPEPTGKAACVIVVGVYGACESVIKSGKAVKAAEEGVDDD